MGDFGATGSHTDHSDEVCTFVSGNPALGLRPPMVDQT
jgi:hypothetical protein